MKIWNHFCTITKHRMLVCKICFKMGLYRQGLFHDLSKYSPAEFIPGCKYYVGYRSPNDMQRMAEGCSTSWLHHKGRNRHHFEYWYDYQISKDGGISIAPVRMPVRFVAEMFADRVAACKTYKSGEYTCSSALEYFLRGKQHGLLMEQDTADLLEYMLRMLSERGEDETCRFIREHVLKEGYTLLNKEKREDKES